jgi:hypothetical protein
MGRGRGTWGGEGACERACHRVLHAHPACSRALGWVRVGGTCPGRRQDGAASCPPARLSTLPEKRVLATRFPQPPQAGRLRIFCVSISSHAELSRPRESRRVRVRRPASAEPRATTGRRHAAPSCVWSLRSSPQLPGPPGARALRCSLKVGPPWGQAPVCARRGLRGLAGV